MKHYWHEFINTPEGDRPWYKVIGWWEARRLPYNLYVMALCVVLLIPAIIENGPDGDLGDPFLAVYLLPPLVNVCYTLGWITELGARMLTGRDQPKLGPRLLMAGLAFTASLPVLLAVVAIGTALFKLITG